MELEEGVDRVQRTLQVFRAFKHTFQQYRDRLSPMGPYSQPGCAVKPWDFPSQIIFQRTDRINERLLMIEVSDYKRNHLYTRHLIALSVFSVLVKVMDLN